STNNHQLMQDGAQYAWIADAESSQNKYIAVFNAPPAPPGRGRRGAASAPASQPAPGPITLSIPIADLKLDPSLKVTGIRDLWSHKDLGAQEAVSATLQPHQSAIFEVQVGKK